jgi:hypothetical protein
MKKHDDHSGEDTKMKTSCGVPRTEAEAHLGSSPERPANSSNMVRTVSVGEVPEDDASQYAGSGNSGQWTPSCQHSAVR